ncbi:MAG: SIS domain-containing protein, partial [Rhodospirillales bacterium]|nr:SIS domain-containing protein [Rhodospirillales bacterium]
YAFHYAYSMFRADAVLLDGRGGAFADALRRICSDDVLFVIGLSPYTDWSVKAAGYAVGKGAKVIALTDSPVSPLAKNATVTLYAGDDSPSFYQSFVGPMAVAQALVALIASRGGDAVLEKIAESERQLEEFGAYWQETPVRRRKGKR